MHAGDVFATSVADERDAEGARVFNAAGGDWDDIVDETSALHEERIVVNMGPQHPSTHGVLRLILELDGETVTETRAGIGYLHTGIEKLLGITDQIPERASIIRVLLMELNRIGSHLVCLATGGMELGALTGMTAGFREREEVLHLLEFLTGLRMYHAFIRPGGLAQDFPEGWAEKVTDFVAVMRSRLPDYDKLLTGQPIWRQRLENVGYLPLDGCLALGATGPILRSAGLPWDLRKVEPYCGYDEYDFDVPTATEADCYARYRLRVAEMWESLKIIEQAVKAMRPGPVMVEDRKIAWPAQLSIGSDGMGNTLEHVKKIMGQSMESLIHHFKLVTEGFAVPPGQVYTTVESPRGELGYHLVSDGGTRPLRVHVREPSFVNLQSMPAMSEGGMIADVIAAVASIDPVMGGCDR
jgi:NADH-quinone oxidoreductase subunit D